MVIPVESPTCSQAGCKASSGGQCLEGFPKLTDCPHFAAGPSASVNIPPETAPTAAGSPPEAPPGVQLPTGEDRDASEASEVTRDHLCRVIVVAGEADSGKTTLIASLHDRFSRGGIGDYLFAGSRTLIAFERRCHLARAESGRTTADTPRTSHASGQRFLHIAVSRADRPTARRHFILSDLSGEHFRLARNSREEALALAFVSGASHFVLLLDGEKLGNTTTRAAARANADQIVRSVLEEDLIGSRTYLDVVFTKWDRILSGPNKTVTQEYVADTQYLFEQRYAARVRRLRFFFTALRASHGGLRPPGFDIDQLLRPWVEDPWAGNAAGPPAPRIPWPRSFDNFGQLGERT